ncbi:MAG: 4Fe-4S binding protein [Eubacteriales bacterium]|nr:4Fe-4S binding protein [Eubacteriales bacterium]
MKIIVNIIRALFLGLFLFIITMGKPMLWLALFGVSLIAALLFGRIFCGYVCPMNTLMIPTEWLSKKLNIQTGRRPRWLKNGIFAWIALGVTAVFMIVSKRLFKIDLPIMLVWLALSVLVTLRYKPEVFHNLICPFGALQRTFGRFAKFSQRVDKNSCIGCKMCEKVCPSAAIVVRPDDRKAVIDTSACHQCINCRQVCPTKAISYLSK